MKALSLSEFKRFCENKNRTYVVSSKNQQVENNFGIHFTASYDTVFVFKHPDEIVFAGGEAKLILTAVDRIEIEPDHGFGETITFICYDGKKIVMIAR